MQLRREMAICHSQFWVAVCQKRFVILAPGHVIYDSRVMSKRTRNTNNSTYTRKYCCSISGINETSPLAACEAEEFGQRAACAGLRAIMYYWASISYTCIPTLHQQLSITRLLNPTTPRVIELTSPHCVYYFIQFKPCLGLRRKGVGK
jgi:hypothetical protein